MPIKGTIYRVTGDEAVMDAIDARHAVRNHPDEWSYDPFTPEQQQEALRKVIGQSLDLSSLNLDPDDLPPAA